MVILIMKLDFFFWYLRIMFEKDIYLKKKKNIKEDEIFEVTKKSKRMIKKRKRKIDEEKNSMIKIESDKKEKEKKEKK